LDEGRGLAALLSHLTKDPHKTIIGLWELFVNAVEHGNLGIGYQEKSELRKNGHWYEEIIHRLDLPENQGKKVMVHITSTETEISFLIEDEGNGFDWHSFTELSMERIFDMHGRGVTMAKNYSFDTLEYLDKGNRVMATVKK
jgi:anti-sigma regulatory factor (Ser/Thr protein kinase)